MAIKEVLKEAFRPEFLNRIDEVLVFHRLAESHMRRIAEIQLGHLRQRLAERKIGLEVTDAALERLAKDGYDPAYGARPLKRLIQQYIENPLAKRMLAGEFNEGDTVQVDVGGLMFEFRAGTMPTHES
jgi:ATP-dependent Clp protease ATP-binding subunit ClpB